jgi:hypothetical protein
LNQFSALSVAWPAAFAAAGERARNQNVRWSAELGRCSAQLLWLLAEPGYPNDALDLRPGLRS